MNMPREWTRGVQWKAGSRETWEPVLRAAQAAWTEMETVSVTEGIRSSALLHLEARDLPPASADCARMGLALSILDHAADGSFRAAIHAPELTAPWAIAWAQSDHEAIGRMLGFPECCRKFFATAWASTNDRDVTPAMGDLDGPWEANTMLRWIGVRLVPYLPCSAKCEKTLENARAYVAMGARLGVDVSALEKLMRLPVTHDALNGVVIVSTPHFRFMAGGNRETFKTARPADAARPGGETHADVGDVADTTWTDNGFGSMRAMAAAHDVVAAVFPGGARSALDLGCGDGRLLWELSRGKGGPWHGIDIDQERVDRGHRRHGSVVTLQRDSIRDALIRPAVQTGIYDVVLLMPGRLLEMAERDAADVRRLLKGQRLVLYAYGDWLQKYGGLEPLASIAGFELAGAFSFAPGVEASEGVVR